MIGEQKEKLKIAESVLENLSMYITVNGDPVKISVSKALEKIRGE